MRAGRAPTVPLVLVSGLALLGCGSTYGGGSTAAQVTAWATSTGLAATMARVQGDLEHAGAATGAAAVRTACDVLVTDSLAANEQLPAPDGTLTAALAKAYGTAGASGRDCFSGAGGNAMLLARSATERSAALSQLVQAEARYDDLTSSLPGGSS